MTVTIAVLWVGYKVLFAGNTLRECAPIIIGAIIIASASEVARMMVG
ncbi:Conjugal transfer protein [Pseudomonas syringae pv. cilantro]|uniref:Conjugal transfer protein n=1 Tax=Pseudomonas syringae pv. cilantro TaxID=81035 RepID=A0A0N0GE44_PSESX|nr:Conjugal transfer protein [Pseudomonas syringae pv. cilantro]KPC27230.1 Conjugal transfer protein [Pseudomonas syringae pv. cilantro]